MTITRAAGEPSSTATDATAGARLSLLVIGGGSGCIEQFEVLPASSSSNVGSSSSTGSSGSSGGTGSSGGAVPLLAAPLEPCFFRAATDNDRGGSGGSSYAGRWVAAGLDRLRVAGERGGVGVWLSCTVWITACLIVAHRSADVTWRMTSDHFSNHPCVCVGCAHRPSGAGCC